MQFSIVLTIFILSTFMSCKVRNTNVANFETKCNTDKEIPVDEVGMYDKWYINTKQRASQLKLDSLECGFDSIQIRIWLNYSLAKENQVLILKKKNAWQGELINLEVDSESYGDYDKIIQFNSRKLDEVKNWTEISEMLLSHNILNLKHVQKAGADGVSYCIEIATIDRYRFYRIWSPKYSMNENRDAYNLVQILEFLENKFKFKRIQE